MERKNGNITTSMLGASTCSENRLSRLISRLRQAMVIGCFAMTLLILAFPAQGGTIVTNGSFDTPGLTASFAITNNLPGWAETGLNGFLDCLTVPGSATTDACGNGLKMWGGLLSRQRARTEGILSCSTVILSSELFLRQSVDSTRPNPTWCLFGKRPRSN